MSFYSSSAVAAVCFAYIASLSTPQIPSPREVGFDNNSFEGRVTHIDREGITLLGFALSVSRSSKRVQDDSSRKRVYHLTGERLEVRGTSGTFLATKVVWTLGESAEITLKDGRTVSLGRTDQPLRAFRFNDQLRAGGYSTEHLIGFSYRVQDVKVGDEVGILFQRDEELPRLCEAIMIIRRPGGRIPRAPNQGENDRYTHHERMQAQQDWEELGIHPPAHYRWGNTK